MTVRTCGWIRKRLPLLAGGELIGEERRQVERHLRGCTDCQDLRDRHEGSLSALRVASASIPGGLDAPHASLWPDVAARIRESRQPAARTAWIRWGLASASGIAAGLMIFACWPRATAPEATLVMPVIEQPATGETVELASDGTSEAKSSEVATALPVPVEAPAPPREERPARNEGIGLTN